MQMDHSSFTRREVDAAFLDRLAARFGGRCQVGELARGNDGGDFRWSNLPEERARLWKARHEVYYATLALRPNAISWTTDVCVPISRLPDCIDDTKHDLAAASLPATILGHVSDGNFHVIFPIVPTKPEELAEVEAINERLVLRALAMGGTCTGEHGIGLGKQPRLLAELEDDAVAMMRTVKRALDPTGLLTWPRSSDSSGKGRSA